jgi:hypothetical protein
VLQLDRSGTNPDGPALAYFCRSYAMGKCLKLKGSSSGPEITSFLGSLMGSLETARNTVVGTTKEAGQVSYAESIVTYLFPLQATIDLCLMMFFPLTYFLTNLQPVCENFAFSIFMEAEEEDRSGNITGATAKQFYAAALMFEVCEQFGELDAEVCVV